MFHSTLRCVPEVFYRIHSLKGEYSLIWGMGLKPLGGKMVPEHFMGLKGALKTQVNTVGCISFEKTY